MQTWFLKSVKHLSVLINHNQQKSKELQKCVKFYKLLNIAVINLKQY